jgi:hypothetical protein
MWGKTGCEFVPGDRVIFQYAHGPVLRGTIEGWTDKYATYMLRCDTGRKLLVSPLYLRREPAEDPIIRQEREKDWPSYVVYTITNTGIQQVWEGKARTPRLAFLRASAILPALLEVVRCKEYKRLNARRKYPVGSQGERIYCEKVDTAEEESERVTHPEVEVGETQELLQPDQVRRSHAKSVRARHRVAQWQQTSQSLTPAVAD